MAKMLKKKMQTGGKAYKKINALDDDRETGMAYARYLADKKAGKVELEPSIQKGIKSGKLNPNGTVKNSNIKMSEPKKMGNPKKMGGKVKKK